MKKSRVIIIVLALLCVIGALGRKKPEPKPQTGSVEATIGERTVTIRDWTPDDAPVDQEAIDRALEAFPEPTPTPSPTPSSTTKRTYAAMTYILNTDSKTFHRPGCSAADRIKSENKSETTASRESLLNREYNPCGVCNP